MSQNDQFLSLLKQVWPDGMHSHTLRRDHSIGDPGRRAADLRELGHDVYSKLERRGTRHGVRYFLRRHEFDAVTPLDAEQVPSLPGVKPAPVGRQPVPPAAAVRGGPPLKAMPEVSLADVERACELAKDLPGATLETAILAIPTTAQTEMAA